MQSTLVLAVSTTVSAPVLSEPHFAGRNFVFSGRKYSYRESISCPLYGTSLWLQTTVIVSYNQSESLGEKKFQSPNTFLFVRTIAKGERQFYIRSVMDYQNVSPNLPIM